jgi:hypothetical protein
MRLDLLRLEDRTVPANLVWTGDVDANWGTNQLGNTNWAFDLLPHNGDSLIFPGSSQHHSNANNLTSLVINNFTVQYSQATISGNGIKLTGNFTDSSNGSSDEFTLPLTLSAGAHTFTISAASDDMGQMSETGGAASVVKEGGGGLLYVSNNSYTGVTTVNDGNLLLVNPNGISIDGDLVVNHGDVLELTFGDHIVDTAAVTVNSGCILDLGGLHDRIGSLHVASGGELSLAGGGQGVLVTNGGLSFDSGSSLEMQVGRATADDFMSSFGPVHVGGTLGLTIGPDDAVGRRFTLIGNNSNDPVTGTFDGLPQDAIVDIGSRLHTMNYAGGSSGTSVALTRRANVTVTGARVNDGATQRSSVTSVALTFSDPVDFSITPSAAFSFVRNSDGAAVSLNATATIVGGVTVVTLDHFGGNATEFGSLADGRYTLTALASQISFFGELLDANGDGASGDNFVFGLFRFFGDVNGDQTVNGFDLGFFRNAFGAQAGDPNFLSFLDFNGDGVINGFDLGQFRTRFGTSLP